MKKPNNLKKIVKENLSPTLLIGWLIIAAVLFGAGMMAWKFL